jgi:hypothetical protein
MKKLPWGKTEEDSRVPAEIGAGLLPVRGQASKLLFVTSPRPDPIAVASQRPDPIAGSRPDPIASQAPLPAKLSR